MEPARSIFTIRVDGNRLAIHSYLIVWKYDERSTASALDDDREELGVDSTERRIPRALAHSDIIVALLPLERLPVHMPELGTANDSERHLKCKQ